MRKNRILHDGAEYHVTARINRGEMIFLEKESRDLFLVILKRARKKYKFTLKNFSIMGNHIHLLIKPGRNESLSRIMQWILSVFAQYWNKKHYLSGHLWGDRFFSRVISGFFDFIKVFRYIDNNPITANIVKNIEQWQYSGLWHHKNGIKEIVDNLDPFELFFLPEHKQLTND